MNKAISRILNAVLFATLIIFIFVYVMATRLENEYSRLLFGVLPGIQIFFGIVATVFALKVTRKAYQLFLSLFVTLCGIFQVLMVNKVLTFTLKQGWPLIGVFGAVVLFISGFVKYRKIKVGYLFPAVMLLLLSIWYLLFSFKLVPFSFTFVVSTIGPIFVILIVMLLVGFFILQQRHKELVITDDEAGVFSDEDISSEKF